jgi:hypothetical protein
MRHFVASAPALAGFKSDFCNDAKSFVKKRNGVKQGGVGSLVGERLAEVC